MGGLRTVDGHGIITCDGVLWRSECVNLVPVPYTTISHLSVACESMATTRRGWLATLQQVGAHAGRGPGPAVILRQLMSTRFSLRLAETGVKHICIEQERHTGQHIRTKSSESE